jgi:hypothetical protein
VTAFTGGTTVPELADDNASAIQALREAYVAQWADNLRDGHATWADLVTVFAQTERKEEILAAALLRLAETDPQRLEYARGYRDGFRSGQADCAASA